MLILEITFRFDREILYGTNYIHFLHKIHSALYTNPGTGRHYLADSESALSMPTANTIRVFMGQLS